MGLVPNLGWVTDAFSHAVTLHEYAPPTTDENGNRIRGAETTRTIRAHVFPTPGETLRILEVGTEGGAVVTVRTTEALRLSDADGGAGVEVQSPAITWNGHRYKLFQEGQRTALDGEPSQHEYYARRVRQDGDRRP